MTMNENLKSCMEDLTKESISNLSQYYEKFIPNYIGSAYEHTIKNLSLVPDNELVSENLFSNLISEKSDMLMELKSYKEYLSIVTKDPTISVKISREIGIWGSPIFRNPFDYVRKLILPLLKSDFENKTFDRDLFTEIYCNLEKHAE